MWSTTVRPSPACGGAGEPGEEQGAHEQQGYVRLLIPPARDKGEHRPCKHFCLCQGHFIKNKIIVAGCCPKDMTKEERRRLKKYGLCVGKDGGVLK